MLNLTDMNSEKPAPPKGKIAKGYGLMVFGYRCAKCGTHHTSPQASRFKMYKGKRRRIGPCCLQDDRQERNDGLI